MGAPCARRRLPTFLYAMPFSRTRIFLEETSLVARPAVAFPELKRRLDARMAHLGIRITGGSLCTLLTALAGHAPPRTAKLHDGSSPAASVGFVQPLAQRPESRDLMRPVVIRCEHSIEYLSLLCSMGMA